LKICFFGLGSIGQRHLRLINEGYNFDVYAYRTLIQPLRSFGVPTLRHTEVFDWDTIDQIKPDVAFITNPTYLHIKTAVKCLQHGINKIFLEKPIDCKTDGLERLLYLADSTNAVIYVAYPLRHLEEINKVKEWLESDSVFISCKSNLATWRPYKTYSAYAEQGGGAILELSHEIDLAEHLLGPIVEIRGKCGKTKNGGTDAEEFCAIVCQHKKDKWSNIVLDISWKDKPERYIIYNDGRARYDYQPDDDMYRNQLRYFFDNLDNPKLMNNILDASLLFRKIIEFREKEGTN